MHPSNFTQLDKETEFTIYDDCYTLVYIYAVLYLPTGWTTCSTVQVPEMDRCTDNKAKIEYHIYIVEEEFMMEIQVEETKVANKEIHSHQYISI